jgi:hypothetical protein
MKRIMITLLMGTVTMCSVNAGSKEYREHLRKEFSVSDNASSSTLFIYNISGSIKIEGGSGNQVTMDIDNTISAENDKDIETGKKEFKLGFSQKSDSIIAYIAEPFDSRPHTRNRNNFDRDIEYEYNADFTVKVPAGINIHISTVNNGIIEVNNVNGNLHVNNVNEEIRISNARGRTYAHTVNGDVTVTYLSNPGDGSSYNTINGDIKVSYQPDLSADLQFRSMNGEFFTNFPSAQLLPAHVKKTEEKKGNTKVYKLDSTMAVRFGKGGSVFKFETLNGNVYIKKQS